MTNKFKLTVAALAVTLLTCVAFTPKVSAVPINGAINFTGNVQLNTSSAATATAVTAWSGLGAGGKPQVAGSSGSFAAFAAPGAAVTFTAPWSFNSGAIPSFWTVGGFTFSLSFSTITSQGINSGLGFVTAGGMGTVSGNGFDTTVGTWSFSTQDPGTGTPPTFSFSAGTSAIPEGGTTLALLGSALVGVELLRRKLVKA